jgi:5-methylcytosine-specific restriction endonuclease McrA
MMKVKDKIDLQKISESIEDLLVYPFPCANCGKLLSSSRLFCSDLCRDEAKFVRYCRACIADGRYRRDDVKEAWKIRLAHILNGGYRERNRQISKEIREAAIEQDNGLCRKCGNKGFQVDHINGDSNAIENLQLLCIKCHLQKTREKIVAISKVTHPEKWEKRQELLFRVHAPKPLKLCDSPFWTKKWILVKKRRRELYDKYFLHWRVNPDH